MGPGSVAFIRGEAYNLRVDIFFISLDELRDLPYTLHKNIELVEVRGGLVKLYLFV
jgi:hypothetical protein